MNIEECNKIILERLSLFLNNYSDYINKDMIDNMMNSCNLNEEESYRLLLASVLGFSVDESETDRFIYNNYFREMVTCLDENKYINNEYYKNISFKDETNNKWEITHHRYRPYECFVYDDLNIKSDGRVIPQIGFFKKEFIYPVVLENDREWMLIIPNEIETMKDDIDKVQGNVLTFGLGLGYFQYMISLKDSVESIVIVEKDKSVIELFENNILPQFKNGDKIKIINDDAFDYIKSLEDKYDYVYVDLWHDPSDGIPMYEKFKLIEKNYPNTKFLYWIEKTMIYYTD